MWLYHTSCLHFISSHLNQNYMSFLSLLCSCSLVLFSTMMKRILGGQHAPVCCSTWSSQVDGGETQHRARNKKAGTVSLMVIEMPQYEMQDKKNATDSVLQIVCLSAELDNVEHRFVGPGIIDTALRVCQEFLSVLEHSDIDITVETPPSVEEKQWAEFLQDYYMVVQ